MPMLKALEVGSSERLIDHVFTPSAIGARMPTLPLEVLLRAITVSNVSFPDHKATYLFLSMLTSPAETSISYAVLACAIKM